MSMKTFKGMKILRVHKICIHLTPIEGPFIHHIYIWHPMRDNLGPNLHAVPNDGPWTTNSLVASDVVPLGPRFHLKTFPAPCVKFFSLQGFVGGRFSEIL